MTNAEKYKTAAERTRAMKEFCGARECLDCPIELGGANRANKCSFLWLELEAEDVRPEPCPFCGARTVVTPRENDRRVVICTKCSYRSREETLNSWAIAAHNRVYRAVKAGEGANDE